MNSAILIKMTEGHHLRAYAYLPAGWDANFCFFQIMIWRLESLTPEEISIPIHYISKDLGLFNGNNSGWKFLCLYLIAAAANRFEYWKMMLLLRVGKKKRYSYLIMYRSGSRLLLYHPISLRCIIYRFCFGISNFYLNSIFHCICLT